MATHLCSPASQHEAPNHKVLEDEEHGRILCLADVRGRLSTLNELAQDAGAVAIIHTGDFGFFDRSSPDRINDRTLRHLILYSPLISPSERDDLLAEPATATPLRLAIANSDKALLSEFPQLLAGELRLTIPVYTVWGACEDVSILEKFRSGEYNVENLHILDEATTQSIDVGGVKLRLLGLGGALVPHKLFDNGDGRATIAGGQGTMWTTALQIGELVDTAQRCYDQTETRLFVSHTSPGREGIIAQLALVLKADLTISAGLHFRYASSYNEFSVQNDMEGFRHKLVSGKENFHRVWENVKVQVESVIDDNQRILLEKCLSVVERVPSPSQSGISAEEPAWKNCWNWNLCDAAYGYLILDIKEGRVSADLRSQGFNYAYRRTANKPPTTPDQSSASPNNHHFSSHRRTNGARVADSATSVSEVPADDRAEDDKNAKKSVKREKERERDGKDGAGVGSVDIAENGVSAAAKPLPRSLVASPAPSASASASRVSPMDLMSPTETSGARTPVNNRPKRNPWTLFIKQLPVPVSEDELKTFFGPAASKIISVKIPINHADKQQKAVAFVEFGDKDAMEDAINKHHEALRDTRPKVTVAADPAEGGSRNTARGAGRGRGGYARVSFGGTTRGRGDSGDGPSARRMDVK